MVVFLLEAGEHAAGFLHRRLIHAALLEPFFKHPDIGHAFRMHFIELLFQERDLLANRGLAVIALVFHHALHSPAVGELHGGQRFPQHLFHPLRALLFAVLAQQVQPVFLLKAEPDGQHAEEVRDGAELGQHMLFEHVPALHIVEEPGIAVQKARKLHAGAEGLHDLLILNHGFVRIQPSARSLLKIRPDHARRSDKGDIVLEHTLGDGRNDADGIEAVLRLLLIPRGFRHGHEQHLLPRLRKRAACIKKVSSLHIYGRIRHDRSISDSDKLHEIPPFERCPWKTACMQYYAKRCKESMPDPGKKRRGATCPVSCGF